MVIRAYRPDDRDALYDICLRTGAAGTDATPLHADPRLLGDVYVGPYLHLEPDLAFVAVDDTTLADVDGGDSGGGSGGGSVGQRAVASARPAVLGYVLGVRDTADFEADCERTWWPPLRAAHPLPVPDAAATDVTGPSGLAADAALVARVHDPPRQDPAVVAAFPAHLHVNLLPAAQGHGMGRRLVRHLLDQLAAMGVSGVHLGVDAANVDAAAFYERLGFAVVARDADGLVMGRSTRW